MSGLRLWDTEQKKEVFDKSSTIYTCPTKWDDRMLAGSGVGSIVQGVITSIRNHTVRDSSDFVRYIAIVVKVNMILKRRFDKGVELEPGHTQRKRVGHGYLNIYEEIPAEFDSISISEFETARKNAFGSYTVFEGRERELHPIDAHSFEFWGNAEAMRKLDLSPGTNVRFKTIGDSMMIESLTNLVTSLASDVTHAGEGMLGTWTDKIAAGKDAVTVPQDEVEGVDDDEWD